MAITMKKMWSLESSQRSRKSWEKWTSEKEQTCASCCSPLRSFWAPLMVLGVVPKGP